MMTLEDLLETLNNFHSRHGVTILSNEPKPLRVRIKNCLLKIAVGCFFILLILASTNRFSNNDRVNRMLNRVITMIIFEILFIETLFWTRRKMVLELVKWCHQIETHQVPTLNKPVDWFARKRNRTLTVIKYFDNSFMVQYVVIMFLVPILFSYILGQYRLAISFDLKNFSEYNSLPIFFLEGFIYTTACWFLAPFLLFSFSFFIFFSNYIIGQLELIEHYILQLDLNDVKKLRYNLKEIVKLHLDVLR